MSTFAFISPVSPSTVAPAINQAVTEFAITSDAVVRLAISVFILAHGGQRLPVVNLLLKIDAVPSSLRTLVSGPLSGVAVPSHVHYPITNV